MPDSKQQQIIEQAVSDLIVGHTSELAAFCDYVRERGKELYRDLPWRNTHDPYHIWLSEVMLQQTQVSRVREKWLAWIEQFPTIDALSAASQADVLQAWQGLGYNRRALALKRAATTVSVRYQGELPADYEVLLTLDGIGPATAAGICAFAFEQPSIYIETNVRTVFIGAFRDHFAEELEAKGKISDRSLVPFVQVTCPGLAPDEINSIATISPRAWYYALLDLGAEIKASSTNDPARLSAQYAKQSTFEGSHRQKRAFLLRHVLGLQSTTLEQACAALNEHEDKAGREHVDATYVKAILDQLAGEGFLATDPQDVNRWMCPST